MIVLSEYDPDWPRRFKEAASELAAVSNGDWTVEHIGSTAIPGLCAKPIVDLAVRVQTRAHVVSRFPDLRTIGWEDVDAGPKSHLVLVKQAGGHRTHIAHFFTVDQWDTCNQRLFRAWLLEHPSDRHRYAVIKRAAIATATDGRDYTARKTEFVQEIVDRARAARGLPRIDVWDK
jgi:GrpB-like predicted nucleotidyltransferase (UPF0157 family)